MAKFTAKFVDILEKHRRWLDEEEGGELADLSGADLRKVYLRGANLREADLWEADLRGANFLEADLRGANFQEADLRGADLREAKLWRADLRKVDLREANLRRADLWRADLRGADLSGADLHEAGLQGADLRGADLSGADLSGADLREANLSGARGLIDPISFIAENFETTAEGIIVYKIFGFYYEPNPYWEIKSGAIIEEVVDYNRTIECGCGINVATLSWIKESTSRGDIWKCLIRWEWLPGVCVPYNTDGKIRASKVQLIEIVQRKERGDNYDLNHILKCI